MDIEGLGDKSVEQLVDEGLVSSPADLYALKFEQIVDLEGFAELSSKKLLSAIEDSKKPSLARFIYALGHSRCRRRDGQGAGALSGVRWSGCSRRCRKC